MSIRRLIWLNLIVLLALTGIGCFVGYSAVKNASDLASQIKPPDTHLLEAQLEWQRQLLLVEQLVQYNLSSSHLITENILSRLNQSVTQENFLLDNLRSRQSISPDLLAQLDKNLLAYHQARDLLLRQADKGRLANIVSFYQTADELLDFGAYLVSLNGQAGFRKEKVVHHLDEIASRLVLLFIFAVMVAALIFLIMEKNLLNPVLNVTAQLGRLNKSSGDLRLHFREDDTEIGQLARAINLFLTNIRDLITQLQTSSHALLVVSNQISNSAAKNAASPGLELGAISHIATVLQKVADSMEGVGEFAGRANEASSLAVINTLTGNHVVVMAQQGVDQITMEVEQTFSSICDLLNQSQHIVALQGSLQMMCLQMNQLALSAAIETTRVRDPERGLAPLVEEVRQLAQRVGDLTVTLEKNLDSFARGSATAAELIAVVQKQATAIKARISKASNAMTDIANAVDEIRTMNADIQRASDDEHQEIANIRENMVAILRAVRKHRSVGRNLDTSRQQFETQLVKMDGLLRRFRT